MNIFADYMEIVDILGYVAIAILLLSLLSFGRMKKLLIIILAFCIILAYSILKPIYPIGILSIIVIIYCTNELKKAIKKKSTIKLVEVEYNNNYIVDFIKNYKRDIYNYFPFYIPHESHKCFLVMRDMNLAGIFIGNLNEGILTIEIDYIKPIYRDNYIGQYLFTQNTGFFKKMGVKKLIGKSFHKGHSKYLKKMGFTKTYIDDQMFFVKNIE